MATQISHSGSNALSDQLDITFPRGDDRTFPFSHPWLASEISEVEFLARKKNTSEPGTGDAVVRINSGTKATQWSVGTDYTASVTFLDTDTDNFRAADNELETDYVIIFYLNSGDVIKYLYGTLDLMPLVDDDTAGDADIPNWTSRSDYENELEALLAGMITTYITIAAEASDTDIDVADASGFTVGDTVGVVLDSGYQEVTLDSKTATNLDFSTSDPGGLTGAATVNNLVFKVT